MKQITTAARPANQLLATSFRIRGLRPLPLSGYPLIVSARPSSVGGSRWPSSRSPHRFGSRLWRARG